MACGDKKAADTEPVAKTATTTQAKTANSPAGVTVTTKALDVDEAAGPLGALRELGSFDSIELLGSIDLEISQGDFAPLRIEASEEDLPKVVTELDGETLTIGCQEEDKKFTECGPILVHVVLPKLKSLHVRGSGDTKGMTAFHSDTMNLGVHGAGNIAIELHAKRLDLNIQGSANASLSGVVDTFQTTIQGSGSLLAPKLETKDVNVTIQGSGSVQVHVTGALDVSIMGSGSVFYTGAPKVTESIQGSGSVRHVD